MASLARNELKDFDDIKLTKSMTACDIALPTLSYRANEVFVPTINFRQNKNSVLGKFLGRSATLIVFTTAGLISLAEGITSLALAIITSPTLLLPKESQLAKWLFTRAASAIGLGVTSFVLGLVQLGLNLETRGPIPEHHLPIPDANYLKEAFQHPAFIAFIMNKPPSDFEDRQPPRRHLEPSHQQGQVSLDSDNGVLDMSPHPLLSRSEQRKRIISSGRSDDGVLDMSPPLRRSEQLRELLVQAGQADRLDQLPLSDSENWLP
ncbi:MAG: hypothetical protein WD595_01565 [Waddliaceae bacterium]